MRILLLNFDAGGAELLQERTGGNFARGLFGHWVSPQTGKLEVVCRIPGAVSDYDLVIARAMDHAELAPLLDGFDGPEMRRGEYGRARDRIGKFVADRPMILLAAGDGPDHFGLGAFFDSDHVLQDDPRVLSVKHRVPELVEVCKVLDEWKSRLRYPIREYSWHGGTALMTTSADDTVAFVVQPTTRTTGDGRIQYIVVPRTRDDSGFTAELLLAFAKCSPNQFAELHDLDGWSSETLERAPAVITARARLAEARDGWLAEERALDEEISAALTAHRRLRDVLTEQGAELVLAVTLVLQTDLGFDVVVPNSETAALKRHDLEIVGPDLDEPILCEVKGTRARNVSAQFITQLVTHVMRHAGDSSIPPGLLILNHDLKRTPERRAPPYAHDPEVLQVDGITLGVAVTGDLVDLALEVLQGALEPAAARCKFLREAGIVVTKD